MPPGIWHLKSQEVLCCRLSNYGKYEFPDSYHHRVCKPDGNHLAVASGSAKAPKPKRKRIRQLLHGTPITHRPPKAIEAIRSRLEEKDRQFFRDFAGFALLLNRWFDGEDVKSPFRLQELPDIEIQLEGLHTPIYGWRYAIFYNQARLGTLEIWPEHHYTAENPNVHTTIRLGGLRLLPFNTVREFLNTLAMYVCESDQDSKNLQTDIDSALTGVLWQTQQFRAGGEDWGELNLHLDAQRLRTLCKSNERCMSRDPTMHRQMHQRITSSSHRSEMATSLLVQRSTRRASFVWRCCQTVLWWRNILGGKSGLGHPRNIANKQALRSCLFRSGHHSSRGALAVSGECLGVADTYAEIRCRHEHEVPAYPAMSDGKTSTARTGLSAQIQSSRAFREQRALAAIHSLNEAPHPILPRIISRGSHGEAFFFQLLDSLGETPPTVCRISVAGLEAAIAH